MEIAIGIQQTGRELRLEVEGDDTEGVRGSVEEALRSDGGLLWLTDKNGRTVGVPVDKLAYVEVDPQRAGKQVGFSMRNQ